MNKALSHNNFTVIIPTKDEKENVEVLIGLIQKLYPKINIIVTDDASTDGTCEAILKLSKKHKSITLLDRRKSRVKGLTSSVLAAILKVETEFFIVMDGDLQHPPEKLKLFMKRLSEGYDLVVGKRNKVHNWTFFRHMLSTGATLLAKARIIFKRAKADDIMSGFFGAKKMLFIESFSNIQRYSPEGYKILFDFLKINTRKLDVANISYDFGMRKKGSSKIGKKQIIVFLKSLLK